MILSFANEISEKTPNLCHLAPAGHTYMEELNEAGGVYAVMNELNKKGLLHTDMYDSNRKDSRREHRRMCKQRIRKLSVQLIIHTARQVDLQY